VLNGGGANASLAPATFISVDPYLVPLDPTQPDGTATLADNDARLSAKVNAVGGIHYAVHNIEVNGRAAIRWYRLNATNYTLLESGTITDPDLDLFYPSIAANSNGVVVIGCNGCSINTFVSCYALVGETRNGVTTFGNLILLKSGTTSYHGDDEIFLGTGESRWGDYSTTLVDPSDPTRFWTIQMYPSDTDVWSMQITELLTTQLPRLTIEAVGTNVLVSWPNFAAGYRLQSTAGLAPGNAWLTVTQTPFTNVNRISVLIPVTSNQKFFRLRQGL